MKKRMKNYYGWFPALLLLTLLCCMPKTVSALRPESPQQMTPPPGTEASLEAPGETSEAISPPEPASNPMEEVQEQLPENAPEDVPEELPEKLQKVPPGEIYEEIPKDIPEEAPAEEPETVPEEVPQEIVDDFFSDTLFIGDSRTVGLCEYSGLRTATFFSDVGMSVYKVLNAKLSVSGIGEVTLEGLLQQKTFGKIHLMLGINEIGYDFNTTVKTYGNVVELIRTFQPEAVIYLGANLHVGKSRSDTDMVVNNPAIDRFNDAVAAMADGDQIRYVDVNPLFDDETGALRPDLSGDATHVYGACYPQWVQWLYGKMQEE